MGWLAWVVLAMAGTLGDLQLADSAVDGAGWSLAFGPEATITLEDGVLVPLVDAAGRKVGIAGQGNVRVDLTPTRESDRWNLANRRVLIGRRPVDEERDFAHGQAPLVLRGDRVVAVGLAHDVVGGWVAGRDGVEQFDRSIERFVRRHRDTAFGLGDDGLPAWVDVSLSEPHHMADASLDAVWFESEDGLRTWLGNDDGGLLIASPPRPPPPRAGKVVDSGTGSLQIRATPRPGTSELVLEIELRADIGPRAAVVHPELWFGWSDVQVQRATLDGVEAAVANEDRVSWMDRPSGPAALELDLKATVPLHGVDDELATRRFFLAPNGELLHGVRWNVAIATPSGAELDVAMSGVQTVSEEGEWLWSRAEVAPEIWPSAAIGTWTVLDAPSDTLVPVRVSLFPDDAAGILDIPGFVRLVVSYYQQLLPPFPAKEAEIYQTTDAVHGYRWTATAGLIEIQKAHMFGAWRFHEHTSEAITAHELAHQYWGAMASSRGSEDRWFHETLAEAYSCLFLRAQYGKDYCREEQDELEEFWTDEATRRDVASLTRVPPGQWRRVAYRDGSYFVLRTLRARIGDQAMFRGFDGLARTGQHTRIDTDMIQKALEHTSGVDLGPLFDGMVHGGFVPSIVGRLEGTTLVIETGVPFGRTEIPVRIRTGGESRTEWVTVVDGVGRLELGARPRAVLIDPDHAVLARKRVFKKR